MDVSRVLVSGQSGERPRGRVIGIGARVRVLRPVVGIRVLLLRRMTALISQDSANPSEATERFLERLQRTRCNADFLATIKEAI